MEQTKANLISQQKAFVEGQLGAIQNDYVVNPELPSQNTQSINDIYINFLEDDENLHVIINSYSILLSMAHQCPAAGGQSVYRARAMLSLVNDSLEYNDVIVCLQSGIYRDGSATIVSPKFNIIPNPAGDFIDLILYENVVDICKIEIFDMLGKSLINKNIDCQKRSNRIEVTSLNEGIYIVKLYINNEIIESQKLIIIR